jgi:hypothetical protein
MHQYKKYFWLPKGRYKTHFLQYRVLFPIKRLCINFDNIMNESDLEKKELKVPWIHSLYTKNILLQNIEPYRHTDSFVQYISLTTTSLTPYNVVSPENLMVAYLANKFPSFYKTRTFVAVFVRPPLILVLSQTNFIYTFQSYILTRILIIFSHLHLHLLTSSN